MSEVAHQSTLQKTAVTLEMIKFSHSIFALPFALSGMFLAARGWPTRSVFLWVVVAMVAARSAAMAFNRLVDARYDARNPRTKRRALPAGLLSRRFVGGFVVFFCLIFVLAAGQLNPLCLSLSPVALLVILGYSYAKRFTALCHLWLGVSLGITPIAGWIAVTGVVDRTISLPLLLATAVMFWVAGFDLIYACQDEDFDRKAGLRSLPVVLGPGRAMNLAALLHVLAVGSLVAVSRVSELGMWYLSGAVLVALLLVVEHILARVGGGRHLHLAFFHVNSVVGLVVLAAVLVEVLG